MNINTKKYEKGVSTTTTALLYNTLNHTPYIYPLTICDRRSITINNGGTGLCECLPVHVRMCLLVLWYINSNRIHCLLTTSSFYAHHQKLMEVYWVRHSVCNNSISKIYPKNIFRRSRRYV